ncbi:MAG: glutaredoxin family protein [Calditrichaeota bacterium]|nr:glutaredoxin family protein [Calditrichota bacterium]
MSSRNSKTQIKVEIFSKRDCPLCDIAKAILVKVQEEIPFELQTIDITGDRELFSEYKEQIPVIFINGSKAFKYRVDESELRKRLVRHAPAPGFSHR